MTDQPRDLAKEAEEISRIHDEGRYDQYGEFVSESIGDLLDFIASQSRELEELRASRRKWAELGNSLPRDELMEIRREVFADHRLSLSDAKRIIATLDAKDEELAALRDERNDWRKLADERSAEIVRLDRELRRPVVQSEYVERVRQYVTAQPRAHEPCQSHFDVLLSGLDQAQREKEGLQTVAVQLEEVCRIKDQQIARLSSPPEERRDIVERLALARQEIATPNIRCQLTTEDHLDDIDTLLQDAARYRSVLHANGICLDK